MHLETLKTERLQLIKVDQTVMDYVFQEFSGEQQMIFLGCNTASQLAEQQRRYEAGLSTYNKKFLYFFLVHKKTDQHLGWCGYHTWYTQHSRAEIGYEINDAFQNKGLMTEALISIIAYGFKNMNLNRIEAMVGLKNRASLRLMDKFQFKKEGCLREHYFTNGTHEPSEVYSLLKKEYNLPKH